MLRSLRPGLSGPTRRWGFAWDNTWWGDVWCPSETFWCRTRGPDVDWWWPLLSCWPPLGQPFSCASQTGARFGCSPLMAMLLVVDLVVDFTSQGCSIRTWSHAPPCKVARQGLGHPSCLTRLLGRDLVIRSVSQGCSAQTWSPAPLRKVALSGPHELNTSDSLDA
jgi:hypothetical protein